jgi:hypothetical protein
LKVKEFGRSKDNAEARRTQRFAEKKRGAVTPRPGRGRRGVRSGNVEKTKKKEGRVTQSSQRRNTEVTEKSKSKAKNCAEKRNPRPTLRRKL